MAYASLDTDLYGITMKLAKSSSFALILKVSIGYCKHFEKKINFHNFKGNVCGSFGVYLEYGDGFTAIKPKQEICYTGIAFSSLLPESHQADITLW